MSAAWYFGTVSPQRVEVNPTHGEFFTNEQIERDQALVREGIQNTLDARAPGRDDVLFRVTIGDLARPLSAERRAFYQELDPHLEASGFDLPEDTLSWIVVEDFGTTGLTGSTEPSDFARDESNNYRDFFWRVGSSTKGGEERGRWGLGRTAYPNASRIRSIHALTVRSTDFRALLLGQAALKPHSRGATRYEPYGFYGVRDGDSVLSVEDQSAIELFRQAFGLTRGPEPGLSIVVPFLDESVTAQALVGAAIENYFVPILRGELTVEVRTPDNVIRVDRTTIYELTPDDKMEPAE